MSATGPSPRSPRALGRVITLLSRAGRPHGAAAALARARELSEGGRIGEGRERHNPRAPLSILAIKPHDQLGDFLVATPAIRALRAGFPQAQITVATRSYLEPLARRVGAIDRVLVVPRADGPAGVGRLLVFANALRDPPPDIAIVLNSVSRSRTADALAALSGARLVVGRSRVGAGAIAADAPERALDAAAHEAIYDLDLPCARGSAHQVDRVCDLIAWTGAPTCEPVPRLDLVASEYDDGRRTLAALAEGEGLAIGIHPAAANPLKCWPVESFVEWGVRLAAIAGTGGAGDARGSNVARATRRARLIVLDTPKDPGPAHAVIAGLRAHGVQAAMLEARPLDLLLGPLAALDLLACNDSGMMHTAAALGVATLSFHSLGAPAEWAPRSETAIALHAERIAAIAVDDAVRAGETLLARLAARR